jgi:hypothetical protein
MIAVAGLIAGWLVAERVLTYGANRWWRAEGGC